jgi:hypothetical protein
MKPEMRRTLAHLPFEEKIRKVSKLISLSRNLQGQRLREPAETYRQSGFRNPPSDGGVKPEKAM